MEKKIKLIIPEDKNDITLGQFQRLTELMKREDLDEYEKTKRKIYIVTGGKYSDLDGFELDDFNDISEAIDRALVVDAEFKHRFKIGDVEFGMIPNFDKIKAKEFVDLSLYPPNEVDKLNSLMAILFRPIINTDLFGNYSITAYNGTEEYAELMKETPISVVNGALVFFCDLAKELEISTQRYTELELLKDKQQSTSSINGGGIQQ